MGTHREVLLCSIPPGRWHHSWVTTICKVISDIPDYDLDLYLTPLPPDYTTDGQMDGWMCRYMDGNENISLTTGAEGY